MILLASLCFLAVLGVLCVFKSPHALGLFIFIEFFFPSEIQYSVALGGVNVSKVAYLIFFIYTLRVNQKSTWFKYPIFPALMPVFFCVFMFGSYMSSEYPNPLVKMAFYVMPDFFLPGILLFYSIKTYDDLIVIVKWIIFLIFFWTFYGLYEFTSKTNFFINRMIKEFPKYSSNIFTGYHYASGQERFGTSSRIQGTVFHPISFGGRINLFLCLLLFFKSLIKEKLIDRRKLTNLFLLTLNLSIFCILISSLLTFTRTAWLFSIASLGLYVYLNTKYKKAVLFVALPIIFSVLAYEVSVIVKYFDVEGSSVSMRVDQFNLTMKMVSNDLIFGRGADFTQNYIIKYGDHTSVLGFESFFFSVIVNTGIAGIIYYCLFFYSSMKTLIASKIKLFTYFSVYTFLPYIIFILATGEMQTLWLFWLLINVVLISIPITKNHLKVIQAIKLHSQVVLKD